MIPGGFLLRARRIGALFPPAILLAFGMTAVRLGAVGLTRYVDDATCPSSGDGTQGNPFCRIQDAICIAASGDTVSVAPGIYHEAVRMRPGVGLLSQGGAAATTIDAASQPCTDNSFCAKRVGSQCTVVTFASGHTASTRLEGFTITGGAGLVQTNWVAGGGIYVFSSPVIINNVITNNWLSGPAPQGTDLRGAGVYIATGTPILSNNTISGNRAIPSAGTLQASTFGYGGGLWAGVNSTATLTSNVITGNRAGDSATAYSIGAGGGLVVFPGSGPSGPLVDRNLVMGNTADSLGGGISLLSAVVTAAEAVVTNNVVVGNISTDGGGIYTYFVKTRIANNTISGNEAFLGGGLYSGLSETILPVTVTNNIIEGNHVRAFGAGGGFYTLDLDPFFSPTVISNDLYGNQPTQCGGELTDATCIGFGGNFSADPLFVARLSGDYRLLAGSAAIDRGDAATAPPVDANDTPRGIDGDGIPNSPMAGDIDVGAFEFVPGCQAQAETCDNLDNDCDLIVDDGFANTDGDSLADCVDPDDDNDLVEDLADCAALDASAWGAAQEVNGVDGSGSSPFVLDFISQAIGPGTRYEILSGLSSRVRATSGFAEAFCLSSLVASSPFVDTRPAPPVNDAWFYLARAVNACGDGTLGSPLRDAPGSGNVCPAGVVDQDGDGSPSNLDCSDSDPARAPILPEICDGLDNDCDLAVDQGNPGGGGSCGPPTLGECRSGTLLCSVGVMLCDGAVGPGPEFCDGLDNDCDGTPDNNVVDTDGDLLDDCQDTDDDNDTVLDGADCAPRDGTAFAIPGETSEVQAEGVSPTALTWLAQNIGSGALHDVVSGQLVVAGETIAFNAGACLGTASVTTLLDGRPAPSQGAAWYYLVRTRNACGVGTLGTPARDQAPACP